MKMHERYQRRKSNCLNCFRKRFTYDYGGSFGGHYGEVQYLRFVQRLR